MTTATTSLIAIITHLFDKVGDDDGKGAAALAEIHATAAAEEAEIQALREALAALPAPFDPASLEARIKALEDAAAAPTVDPTPTLDLGPLTERVQALEDRNTADDEAAASALPPVGQLQGLADGVGLAALAISGEPLPDPVLGTAYAAQVVAGGGVSPYQFSMVSGALPDGLSMAAGGGITGTPTTAGLFAFEVQVHDANNTAASEAFSVAVAPVEAPAVETAAAK